MKLSLVFMTGRLDPHLDWVLDGLATQATFDDTIELLVIDVFGQPLGERELAIVHRIPGRFSYRVMLPKPNIWQGTHRVTSRDWWATANARNTALVVASHDYIAFLDDRCRLGPRWLETVRAGAAARDRVIVGSYEKLEGTEGVDRRLTQDHRRLTHPTGLRNCGGGWLYGCTFAMPLEWALEVNGLEEGCDGLTGEDYIFGLMLGNAGHRIDFVPDLFVSQDRTPGNESCKGSYACRDKGISPNDKSHAALHRFGKAKRTEFTPDLRALRDVAKRSGLVWPVPHPDGDYRDWYDGEPIRGL